MVPASRLAIIVFTALLILAPPLSAQQTYTWANDTGGGSVWGNSAAWVGAPSPLTFNTQTDIIFDTDFVVNRNNAVSIGGTRIIRSLSIGANYETANNGTFDIRTYTTFGGTANANLRFEAASGNASITVAQSTSGTVQVRLGSSDGGNVVIFSNLDLAQHNTFFGNTGFQFESVVSGAGTINKTGAGLVRMVRNNENWTGGMNINEGEVSVFANGNAMGTGTWTLGGGANNTTFSVGSVAVQNNTGGLVVADGAGTRTIALMSTTTGNPTLAGAITLEKDAILAVTNFVAGTHDRLTLSGAVGGAGGIVKTGSGILLLTGTGNDYSGATDIQGGKFFLGGNGRLGSGDVTIASGANLDFGTGASQINIVANNISGDGQIIQSTAGTETRITGNVTSTGGLTIESGTLRIGDGGTTGSYNGDTVVNGGALAFARSDAYTHGGTISGAGEVSKVSAGVVTLTGNNSYSGNTLLFEGALVADHANALGTGNITFTTSGGGGTLRYTTNSAGTDWASRIKNSSGTIRLDTAGNNVNLAGAIDSSNDNGLVKSGTGTLTLGGANTYAGSTTVANGRLVVNGSITNSTVTVASNATLAGSGTLGGLIVSSGGTINPGNSPGTLSVTGNAVWNAGGNYNWQIHDATGTAGNPTGWDLLSVSGTLDLEPLSVGNEFKINLWSLSGTAPDANGNALNFNPAENRTWTIARALGGITSYTGTGQFLVNVGATNGTGGFSNPLAGGTFSVLLSGDSKDLNLVFNSAAPIPEPGTWAAAALLAAGAAFARWRRHAKAP
jgi:fibronectin-binding autotransporter adhesin